MFMTIGINATAALKQPRCGVEEYSYQLIKHLTMLPETREHRFFLYTPAKLFNNLTKSEKIFWQSLPENFILRPLIFPVIWTQARLSLEMFLHRPELLFIPVHVLPIIHPEKSVVTIHGLEYEYYPEMYAAGHLKYLKWSTKYSTDQARKIIAVSENTKNDLIKFYKLPARKITVVRHGFTGPLVSPGQLKTSNFDNLKPYFLYFGRLEPKKNIFGLVKSFEILKQRYRVPHKLILAGADGFGSENLKFQIRNSRFRNDIILSGYVDEKKKWHLLQGAEIFLFPSFYEGFGLPILEAQACGVPVVTSDISCMPEVAGKGALLVDPKSPEAIAQSIFKILNDKGLRDRLINQGLNNIKRFSWERCARQTLKALVC